MTRKGIVEVKPYRIFSEGYKRRRMYTFIFYFNYVFQLKDNKGAIGPSRRMASMFVTFAIFLQLLLAFCVVRYVKLALAGDLMKLDIGNTYSQKWIWTLAVMLPIFIWVYRYFNETRIEILADSSSKKGRKIYRFINFVKFFAIYLIPLFLSIYLTKHTLSG